MRQSLDVDLCDDAYADVIWYIEFNRVIKHMFKDLVQIHVFSDVQAKSDLDLRAKQLIEKAKENKQKRVQMRIEVSRFCVLTRFF